MLMLFQNIPRTIIEIPPQHFIATLIKTDNDEGIFVRQYNMGPVGGLTDLAESVILGLGLAKSVQITVNDDMVLVFSKPLPIKIEYLGRGRFTINLHKKTVTVSKFIGKDDQPVSDAILKPILGVVTEGFEGFRVTG